MARAPLCLSLAARAADRHSRVFKDVSDASLREKCFSNFPGSTIRQMIAWFRYIYILYLIIYIHIYPFKGE